MTRPVSSKTSVGRRDVLKSVGLAGVAAALGSGLSPRPAAASTEQRDVGTTLMDLSADQAVLRTGPLPTFAAPAGTKIGICFLVGTSGRAGGAAIAAVESAEIDVAGLGPLSLDRGVAQNAYRLIDGLSTARPVELFGVSGIVGDSGLSASSGAFVTWQASLRGGAAFDRARSEMNRFHACIIGQAAEDGRFAGRLSYLEIDHIG